MPEYEKLLTDGRRIRWRGSNGIEYYAVLAGNCRNGNFNAVDEDNGKLHDYYIESVTEIHTDTEILRVESFDEWKARKTAEWKDFREV